MVPLAISYKDFIKNARDKVAARKILQNQLRKEQALGTLNVSETARLWKCSRKTIRDLRDNDDLDYEAKKAPNHCPHKTPDHIESAILAYHDKHGYGCEMIKLNMDTDLPSFVTINRILRDNGKTNKARAYRRKHKARRLKKKLRPFEKWQLDTKYLTDIPNLIPLQMKGLAPKYEYTLRDMKTGTTFLGFGFKERSLNDTLSFLTLAMYHMQLHGIDTHYVTVQSDNGSEILGHIDKKERYKIEELVEDKFGGTFVTIPPKSPTFNSHVESFHGRVETEAYDLMDQEQIKSLDDFINYMNKFTKKWNLKRRPTTDKKTPERRAKEGGYMLPSCFYNFPPLIFDKIQLSLTGNYLPLEVKLSVSSNPLLKFIFLYCPSLARSDFTRIQYCDFFFAISSCSEIFLSSKSISTRFPFFL